MSPAGPAPVRPPSTFGTNLRHYRQQAGLTLTQLAAAAAINYATLYRWETGRISRKRGPRAATIHTLAAALGCTERQLLSPFRDDQHERKAPA